MNCHKISFKLCGKWAIKEIKCKKKLHKLRLTHPKQVNKRDDATIKSAKLLPQRINSHFGHQDENGLIYFHQMCIHSENGQKNSGRKKTSNASYLSFG